MKWRSVNQDIKNQKYLTLPFDVADTLSKPLWHYLIGLRDITVTQQLAITYIAYRNVLLLPKHVPNLYTSIIPNSSKLKTTHKPMNTKMIVLYLQNRIL